MQSFYSVLYPQIHLTPLKSDKSESSELMESLLESEHSDELENKSSLGVVVMSDDGKRRFMISFFIIFFYVYTIYS